MDANVYDAGYRHRDVVEERRKRTLLSSYIMVRQKEETALFSFISVHMWKSSSAYIMLFLFIPFFLQHHIRLCILDDIDRQNRSPV